MIEIFREVRRVLRRDGTVWLNLGDGYFSDRNHNRNGVGSRSLGGGVRGGGAYRTQRRVSTVLKPKDLCGMPWRVAFALQEDGWWLRAEVIWSKLNPMPEPVTDRPARSHESIFLLTKSRRYFFDAQAIKEEVTGGAHARGSGIHPKALPSRRGVRQNSSFSRAVRGLVYQRNKRSVWSVASQPFRGAHFATFPERLIEPCILAGTSARGCCSHCGAPWVREMRSERQVLGTRRLGARHGSGYSRSRLDARGKAPSGLVITTRTVGWKPSCHCRINRPALALVLDPFCGAGTTLMVARKLGRDWLGIELKPEYAELSRKRIHDDSRRLKGR